jgi:hypothetical protein
VHLNVAPSRYAIPLGEQSAYQDFLRAHQPLFSPDGIKYMLVRAPTGTSDDTRLNLALQETSFSVVRYYQQCVFADKTRRDQALEHALARGQIDFPNSLCLHAVVTTTDERVLFTCRSPRLAYYPQRWSVSLEEQLSSLDLNSGHDDVMQHWAARLLREELGLTPGECRPAAMRVLAAFFEVDVMNSALAVVLPLTLASSELEDVLTARPRPDYEFTDWAFCSVQELSSELRSPSRDYHPTATYRMVLYLAHLVGPAKLAELLHAHGAP